MGNVATTITMPSTKTPFPVDLLEDVFVEPPEKFAVMTQCLRVRTIMQMQEFSQKNLAILLTAFGKLQVRNGKPSLAPSLISTVYLTKMLRGTEPMPEWRLGQIVVLLEFIEIERLAQADAMSIPEDDIRATRLKYAWEQLAKFNENPTLLPWLLLFRPALLKRFELDAGKSKVDRGRYERYKRFFDGIRGAEEEKE